MWQNPYANNYNPMAGLTPGRPPVPGQLNLNQFSSPGVITPPPNAAPFQPQPDIPTIAQPYILPPTQPGVMLQPPIAQQMGQMGNMINTAYENFKKSVVDSKEDGDDMILTVKVPTNILKQDPNFAFLFTPKQ